MLYTHLNAILMMISKFSHVINADIFEENFLWKITGPNQIDTKKQMLLHLDRLYAHVYIHVNSIFMGISNLVTSFQNVINVVSTLWTYCLLTPAAWFC